MLNRIDSLRFEDLHEYHEENHSKEQLNTRISTNEITNFQPLKCTPEELIYLDKINKIDHELSESIQKMNEKLERLRKAKRENNLERKKITTYEDDVLVKLLTHKLGTTPHIIKCLVDKYNQTEQITIYACHTPGLIKKIFSSIMSKMPEIVKKGNSYSLHDFSRVIVTFELSERQNLILKLKSIERTENIPRTIPKYGLEMLASVLK
jgi:hypothetical protein